MSHARVPPPEPLQVDAVRVVATGTALWLVALVACLVFRDWLVETGREWWTWTCVTGVVLGLFGIWVVRREQARQRGRDGEGAPRQPLTDGRTPPRRGAPPPGRAR